MKYLKHTARIVFGLLFIFSGFVKGIDPLGSTYKFIDYFEVMNLMWLNGAAFTLGVIQSFVELAIGVALLFNWRVRVFSWLGLLFMVFYTPLTLWIALKDPVTDCGCFGDALVITNWQTFYKNVFLLVLGVFVFVNRAWFEKCIKSKLPFVLSILSFAAYFVLVYYSYNHLPIIDFRPYKIGTNIPDAMIIPDDAPRSIYENVFYYKNKNTGEIKKFSEKNYPWKDTVNWEYNNMESKLIQKGYTPPIHDFTIESPEGDDVKDFFLYDENYVFMLVAYRLDKTSTDAQKKINSLASWAKHEVGASFFCLTSSLQEEAGVFAVENQTPYEYFNCDEITLKTIIRSNPGLVVMKGGIIIGKWHYNDIPTPKEFEQEFLINND